MTPLKAFSILFFCLITLNLAAQYKISGTVTDMDARQKLPRVHVSLSSETGSFKRLAISDQEGDFMIVGLGTGSYQLVVSGIGYKNHQEIVEITDSDRVLNIDLPEEIQELEEVKIYGARSEFEFDKLREVEDMAIFAGKKSELILPENMTINAATNNARQLYSRVAGLNIYENDGAGLQLSIGGRGLDPNRTANFNVRQNGYDISADALGYPESYYTPPVEAIDRIQIVRGAASLQYGTQFGGLLNFILKKPVPDKPLEIVSRQTLGSYGFFNSFNSISGTQGKLSYYSFFQYKRGDGWRPNSDFNAHTAYANLRYQISEKTSIGGQYTRMDYLAHQSGGLTDRQFDDDSRQSNRTRNWFDVNWNLFNLELQHIISDKSKVSLQGFGLVASRKSLGFRPNRPETPDNNGPRDLIDGAFGNWGLESRFMQRYTLNSRPSVLLMGVRYYEGMNQSKQGEGSTGSDADFRFTNPEATMLSDYRFPSRNMAFFAENVWYLSPTLSVTPGFRFEHISTLAKGYYRNIVKDLAGNIMENQRVDESLKRPRSFILFGLGTSYKPTEFLEIYANLSQNYRSITFNDIRVVNPSFVIDPNIKDEKGFSGDIGFRGKSNDLLSYDISAFAMDYGDRIGEVQFDDGSFVKRKRSNIGRALIIGVESYAELNVLRAINGGQESPLSWSIFGNLALLNSKYLESQITGVKGKQVEFVPDLNLKTGTSFSYDRFKSSFQYSYLSQQFTDATNATNTDATGIIGIIPAYHIMDISASYEYKFMKFEASVNNLTNNSYFTRRATGYPGPGILPSDGRSFFFTVQVKF